MRITLRTSPLRVAVMAGFCVAAWWALAVEFAYQGKWNALYCTGSGVHLPEWLEGREQVYRVIGPVGYDGQWFHVLAHRPLEFREHARYFDAARLRVQRILLPLFAWLLAFGRFEWVDPAYYTLMLLWLGAGVWWTARLAELRGASPLWGLIFLALPSTMSSIDRMLSDGPLAAAAAGFFYFTEMRRWRAAWLLAMAAPFIRETGLFLAAAACLVLLQQRRWRRLAAWSAAPVPFLIWLYSLRDLPGGLSFYWKGFFASAVRQVMQLTDYPYEWWLRWLLQGMDLASLAGFLIAMILALRLLWRNRRRADSERAFCWTTGAIFAAAALALVHVEPRAAWDDFYSYGRVFSPIFLVLLLEGLERGRPAIPLAVLAPVTARMGMQFVSPAWRILRGLAGV
jgi:hypothetical protein